MFNIPGFTLNATVGYRITTPAERFEGDFKYRFGNEAMFTAGLQKSFLIKNVSVNPSLYFNYRNTLSDKVDGAEVSGTGGSWVNMSPGINIEPSN